MKDRYIEVLGSARNKLAKIVYTCSQKDGEDETMSYIGELDYLREGYIGIELPYNTDTNELRCGGLGTPVDSVVISPITEADKEIWLEAAIKHIEFCREYDKWDRSISMGGDEYMKECRYIDDYADGRLKRAKTIEIYVGEQLEVSRMV